MLLPQIALLAAMAFPQDAPRIFKAVRSPEVSADRRVTFRFFAPKSEKVALMISGENQKPMEKGEKGVWSTTTEPLEPDIYSYSFVVDGAQLSDPANEAIKPIATGGVENLVLVPGNQLWERRKVPQGVVHRYHYDSKIAGEGREFLVYTPPGYDGRKALPVLYLLHGVMEDQDAWIAGGRADTILDNLIAEKSAKEMLLVMPLGYAFPNVPDNVGKVLGSPPAWHRTQTDSFASILLDEISPQVEKAYKTVRKPEGRAIAGLSMGGAQALAIGLNHQDSFGWIGSFSGAFILYGTDLAPWFRNAASAKMRMLRIACGKDDFLLSSNRKTQDWLKSKGVKLEATESSGAHTWQVWRRNLIDFAKDVFKSGTGL